MISAGGVVMESKSEKIDYENYITYDNYTYAGNKDTVISFKNRNFPCLYYIREKDKHTHTIYKKLEL